MGFDPNSVWFITGASSGLGKSIALAAYESGYQIVATARSVDSLSHLPNEPRVLKLSLNVTSPEQIDSSLTAAVAHFGQVNVVVNNAGYGLRGDTEAISDEDARQQIETNFWGPVRITRGALRIFREVNPVGKGGTIAQISSVGGWVGFPGNAFYHASKFALEGFTESVAKEMDPSWNIKFLIAVPGGVRTNFAATSVQAIARHPAYDTPSSPLSQILNYINDPGSQKTWSHPDICARLLVDTVVSQEQRPLPIRLLMGAETIPLIESDIERTLLEMREWKAETERCSPRGGAKLQTLNSGK
ncbi:SDR family oxidoreductase [Aspergillus undulatus]|uniref:SDR family oxidoreductase n=1 Tax=Aspergillus undulatus TaxID=1810928 RepID=UPI003CCCB73F